VKNVVIVTGSRDWKVPSVIMACLNQLGGATGIALAILGDCPSGADKHARAVCKQLGIARVICEADWLTLGDAAGPIRNKRMVALGKRFLSDHRVVCLAFPLGVSKGTRGCMRLAEEAGIFVDEWKGTHP
jgi:hypothetical protein